MPSPSAGAETSDLILAAAAIVVEEDDDNPDWTDGPYDPYDDMDLDPDYIDLSGSNDPNDLLGFGYALSAGMPVTSWRPATKNPKAAALVARAKRQFEQGCAAAWALYSAGKLTQAALFARLKQLQKVMSRNAYLAGRMAMGPPKLVPDEMETALDALTSDDSDMIDNLQQQAEGAGGLGIVGAAMTGMNDIQNLQMVQQGWDKIAGMIGGIGTSIASLGSAGEMSAFSDLPGDTVLVWWELGAADHCDDCIALSDASPMYLSTLDSNGIFPGSGHTVCGGNCHCELQYDVPETVCGDSMGDGVDEGMNPADLLESDGHVLVFVQEAESCDLPIDVSSLSDGMGLTLDTGSDTSADAFNWESDVSGLMEGGLAGAMDWSVMDRAFAQGASDAEKAAMIGHADAAIAHEVFSQVESHVPFGTFDNARVLTYSHGGSTYQAIFQRHLDAIRFEAGYVTSGPTMLAPDFTMRALKDLSSLAKADGVPLVVNSEMAGKGLSKWLDTLGAEKLYRGPVEEKVELPWATSAVKVAHSVAALPVPAPEWATSRAMVADLTARYHVDFGALANLDFSMTEPAMHQFDTLAAKFGLPAGFKGFALDPALEEPASTVGNLIKLNPEIWSDGKKWEAEAGYWSTQRFTGTMEDWKLATEGLPWSVSSTTPGLITHEFGHLLDANLSSLAHVATHSKDAEGTVQRWEVLKADLASGKIGLPSLYATSDPSEAIAEVFTNAYAPATVADEGAARAAKILDHSFTGKGAVEAPIPDPIGPPKPLPDVVRLPPRDAQLYDVPGSAVPLNAPMADWSGFVPSEPPLPALTTSKEQLVLLRDAAAGAEHSWADIVSGDFKLAFSGSAKDATEAGSHGLKEAKVEDLTGKSSHVIGKPSDLANLEAWAKTPGNLVETDAFWMQLGYTSDDLAKIDAYDAAKAVGSKRLSAGVIVAEPDGRVWIMEPKGKFAGYDNTWSKGGVDAGESTGETAVREMREEMGISAELDTYLGDYASSTGGGITRYYIGHRTGGGPLYAALKETASARLVTPEEAKDLLTKYGKPDSRDQAVLKGYLEKMTPPLPQADYLIPEHDVSAFSDKITPHVGAALDRPPATVEPEHFAPMPGPKKIPPISAEFSFDGAYAKSLIGTQSIVPATKDFPFNKTSWTLPDGTTQPMFWKTTTTYAQWANSKVQIADPVARLNLHVAQLMTMGDKMLSMPELKELRVSEDLLKANPVLREMLIAAGGKEPGVAFLEISREDVIKLHASLVADVPLIPKAAVVTAPAVEIKAAATAGLGGVSPTKLGTMLDGLYQKALGFHGESETLAMKDEYGIEHLVQIDHVNVGGATQYDKVTIPSTTFPEQSHLLIYSVLAHAEPGTDLIFDVDGATQTWLKATFGDDAWVYAHKLDPAKATIAAALAAQGDAGFVKVAPAIGALTEQHPAALAGLLSSAGGYDHGGMLAAEKIAKVDDTTGEGGILAIFIAKGDPSESTVANAILEPDRLRFVQLLGPHANVDEHATSLMLMADFARDKKVELVIPHEVLQPGMRELVLGAGASDDGAIYTLTAGQARSLGNSLRTDTWATHAAKISPASVLSAKYGFNPATVGDLLATKSEVIVDLPTFHGLQATYGVGKAAVKVQFDTIHNGETARVWEWLGAKDPAVRMNAGMAQILRLRDFLADNAEIHDVRFTALHHMPAAYADLLVEAGGTKAGKVVLLGRDQLDQLADKIVATAAASDADVVVAAAADPVALLGVDAKAHLGVVDIVSNADNGAFGWTLKPGLSINWSTMNGKIYTSEIGAFDLEARVATLKQLDYLADIHGKLGVVLPEEWASEQKLIDLVAATGADVSLPTDMVLTFEQLDGLAAALLLGKPLAGAVPAGVVTHAARMTKFSDVVPIDKGILDGAYVPFEVPPGYVGGSMELSFGSTGAIFYPDTVGNQIVLTWVSGAVFPNAVVSTSENMAAFKSFLGTLDGVQVPGGPQYPALKISTIMAKKLGPDFTNLISQYGHFEVNGYVLDDPAKVKDLISAINTDSKSIPIGPSAAVPVTAASHGTSFLHAILPGGWDAVESVEPTIEAFNGEIVVNVKTAAGLLDLHAEVLVNTSNLGLVGVGSATQFMSDAQSAEAHLAVVATLAIEADKADKGLIMLPQALDDGTKKLADAFGAAHSALSGNYTLDATQVHSLVEAIHSDRFVPPIPMGAAEPPVGLTLDDLAIKPDAASIISAVDGASGDLSAKYGFDAGYFGWSKVGGPQIPGTLVIDHLVENASALEGPTQSLLAGLSIIAGDDVQSIEVLVLRPDAAKRIESAGLTDWLVGLGAKTGKDGSLSLDRDALDKVDEEISKVTGTFKAVPTAAEVAATAVTAPAIAVVGETPKVVKVGGPHIASWQHQYADGGKANYGLGDGGKTLRWTKSLGLAPEDLNVELAQLRSVAGAYPDVTKVLILPDAHVTDPAFLNLLHTAGAVDLKKGELSIGIDDLKAMKIPGLESAQKTLSDLYGLDSGKVASLLADEPPKISKVGGPHILSWMHVEPGAKVNYGIGDAGKTLRWTKTAGLDTEGKTAELVELRKVADGLPEVDKLLILPEAHEGDPAFAAMLKDAGATEGKKGELVIARADLEKLTDGIAKDAADWVPTDQPSWADAHAKGPEPKVAPAPLAAAVAAPAPLSVPSGSAGLAAAKLASAKPLPDLIYGYDADLLKGVDHPDFIDGKAPDGKETTQIKIGQGTAKAVWSTSSSGTLGVWSMELTGDAHDATSAAYALTRELGDRSTGRYFLKPEAYDMVPGLKNLLLDTGALNKTWPNVGIALSMEKDQSSALLKLLHDNEFTTFKPGQKVASDFLGYNAAKAQEAFGKTPVFTGKTMKLGSISVDVVRLPDGSMVVSGFNTTVADSGLAAAATISHIAESDASLLTLTGPAVTQAGPRFGDFLLASGAVRDSAGGYVLDSGTMGTVHRYLVADALPVVLGGDKLPPSALFDLGTKPADIAELLKTSTTDTTGQFGLLRYTSVVGSKYSVSYATSGTGLFWRSIEGGTSVAETRATAGAGLRSLLDVLSSDGSLHGLDVGPDVLNAMPRLRTLLAQYGATETTALDGTKVLTLDRVSAGRLRDVLDKELLDGNNGLLTVWPSTDDLTLSLADARQKLSGQTAKALFKDAKGDQWLFKPGDSGRGGATDLAVAQLGEALGLKVPPVRLYTLNIGTAAKPNFVQGSLQRMIPGAKGLNSLSELNPTQMADMLRHSVLDWITANDDAHIGNWIVDKNGDLWSIDKSRSWRTLGDTHDFLGNRNMGNGGGQPLLFQFWSAVQANPKLLDSISPNAVGSVFRKLTDMSDDEFKRIVGPVAAFTPSAKYRTEAATIDAMLARKNSAMGDLQNYWSAQIKDAIARDPASVPTVWKEWLKSGGVFKMDLTGIDRVKELKITLESKFGKFSPARYKQLYQQSGVSTARRIITEYTGPGLSRYAHDAKYAAILKNVDTRGYAADYMPFLIPPDEYKVINELSTWASLSIVMDGVSGGVNPKYDKLLRDSWDATKGKFVFARGSGHFSNPADAWADLQKRGTLAVKSYTMGSSAAFGGLRYYAEVDPEQVFWNMAVTPLSGHTQENEVLPRDIRPDQYKAIRKYDFGSPTEMKGYNGPVIELKP